MDHVYSERVYCIPPVHEVLVTFRVRVSIKVGIVGTIVRNLKVSCDQLCYIVPNYGSTDED